MGPARFHCATLLAAHGLSTYTPSEARSNWFGKTLPELLFCVLPGLYTIKVVVAEWLRRCPTSWVILKQLDPSPSKGHGLIAHSASPHGLLTRSPCGLRV